MKNKLEENRGDERVEGDGGNAEVECRDRGEEGEGGEEKEESEGDEEKEEGGEGREKRNRFKLNMFASYCMYSNSRTVLLLVHFIPFFLS